MAVMLKRFHTAEQGNVAIVFALTLLPMTAFAGAALDYSRAGAARNKLQTATDASALGAAVATNVSTDQQRIALAEALFKANEIPGASASAAMVGGKVVVTARATVKTTAMSLMQVPQMEVGARSVAARATPGPPACVLALNKTVSGAVSFSGTTDFKAVGCTVHSNSRSSQGISVSGAATVAAGGFCSAGGVSTTTPLTPEPRTNCPQLSDAFRNLASPVTTGCTYANNVQVQPNEQTTLSPGIYCSGLSIKGGATLQAGVYVIKGPLTINSQAVVTGTGVTFYLTGSQAGFTINAGAALRVEAPKTGDYGGLLIFQDRTANTGATNTLNGSAGTKLVGAIYTATQTVSVSGGSGFGQQSPLMPIIADQIKFSGSMTANADVSGFNMAAPLPQAGSEARLTE
jgi:Flp pilus assembly protein TadG